MDFKFVTLSIATYQPVAAATQSGIYKYFFGNRIVVSSVLAICV
jgi:hypothetical protein